MSLIDPLILRDLQPLIAQQASLLCSALNSRVQTEFDLEARSELRQAERQISAIMHLIGGTYFTELTSYSDKMIVDFWQQGDAADALAQRQCLARCIGSLHRCLSSEPDGELLQWLWLCEVRSILGVSLPSAPLGATVSHADITELPAVKRQSPADFLQRAGEMFKRLLAAWLRGISPAHQCANLQRVLQALASAAAGSPQAKFWYFALAFIDCLASREDSLSALDITLLKLLNRQCGSLVSDGFYGPVSTQIENLLIALVQRDNPELSKLDEIPVDEDLLLAHQHLSDAMASLREFFEEGSGFSALRPVPEMLLEVSAYLQREHQRWSDWATLLADFIARVVIERRRLPDAVELQALTLFMSVLEGNVRRRQYCPGVTEPEYDFIAKAQQCLQDVLEGLDQPAVEETIDSPGETVPSLADKMLADEGLSQLQKDPHPEAYSEVRDAVDIPAVDELDLRQTCLDEAAELCALIDYSVDIWSASPEQADDLCRHLHTLKGCARMVGLHELAESAHEFESFILAGGKNPQTFAQDEFLDALFSQRDTLLSALANAQQVESSPIDVDDEPDSVPAGLQLPVVELDSLYNLASETSVARAYVEENVAQVAFLVDDLYASIERGKKLLKGIDQELPLAQPSGSSHELSHFSPLQETMVALQEVMADLSSHRGQLRDGLRVVEQSLVQQSRIDAELQSHLQSVQHVSLESIVPRLQHVCSNAAQELQKHVQLRVEKCDCQLERAVMERLLPCLEHLVRNAVAHGIEDTKQREARQKPVLGTIRMRASVESGLLRLAIADDGAGLDFNAIKARAVAQGLLDEDAFLSASDLQGVLTRAGFTTCDEVSAVAGRGLGLDVVSSQLDALNGHFELATQPGLGTEFVLTIPVHYSGNRALFVALGDEIYALPFGQILTTLRMTYAEYEAILQAGPDEVVEYAGESYGLIELSALLNVASSTIDGYVPLVLLQVDGSAIALRVDRLLGSRDIVVQALGGVLSRKTGMQGATIMGDGRVVPILDLPALLDVEGLTTRSTNHAAPMIMVVDDSITVRKVTSRLLGQHQYRVALAKDGEEALQRLALVKPALILLDIEMPRMDGFELVERLAGSGIPIIMISSRAGERHRERAQAMGVAAFMNKPYDETALLEQIKRCLA